MSAELTAEQVRKKCDPSVFDCDSTAELEAKEGIIGQDRALSALRFGLNILKPGFNIYVSGPTGTGKTTAIKPFLEMLADQKETPADWCYVHNFQDSDCPKALELPAGMGQRLQKDVKRAIDSAQRSLAQAFTSKEYAERKAEISEDFDKKREAAFNVISKKAKDRGLLLRATTSGLILVPASNGEPVSEEEYKGLNDEAKDQLKQAQDELTKELKEQIDGLRVDESTVQSKMEDTDREVAKYSINHLFGELKDRYSELRQVSEYLTELEQDVIENFAQFKAEQKPPGSDTLAAVQGLIREQAFRTYEVNLLVDNSHLKGAPVILELNPIFTNLFGRIEKEAQFGALYTDSTMIRSGSLHRANGGYLVVRIEDLLANFQSWEGLKRTLRDGKLVIEEIGERLGFMATKSLRPEPIPLDVKVVVIGEPLFYYMLLRLVLF